MSVVPKPDSTDEMIHQLWYAVIGSNGDGIASRMRRVEETVGGIQKADTQYVLERASSCPHSEVLKDLLVKVDDLSRRPERLAVKIVVAVLSTLGLAFLGIVISHGKELLKVIFGG